MKDLTSPLAIGSWAIASIFTALSSSALAEPAPLEEVRLQLNFSSASVDENWDGGVGIMAQGVFPGNVINLPEEYRLAVGAGLQQWSANDDTVSVSSGNLAGGSASLDGSIRAFQFGASVLRIFGMANGVEITAETGLIYSIISSDASMDVTYDSGAQRSDGLDIDNTIQGIIAVDASIKANEQYTVFGGIGYQFDFGLGDASAFDDSEENDTSALIIRGGVRF